MRHARHFQQQRQVRRHLEYAMGQDPKRERLDADIHPREVS